MSVATDPGPRVVVADDQTLVRGGFLLKDVSPEHLVAAVRLVRCGDALLAPSITRRLVERFAPRAAGAGGPGLAALTPRELEVLGLVLAYETGLVSPGGLSVCQRLVDELA